MKNNEKKAKVKFPSLSTILGVVFIVLKLCGVIEWSWVWVLAPFWIGAIITILTLVFVTTVAAITAYIVKKIDD